MIFKHNIVCMWTLTGPALYFVFIYISKFNEYKTSRASDLQTYLLSIYSWIIKNSNQKRSFLVVIPYCCSDKNWKLFHKMVLGKRFVLKHHFDGMPKPEDFDLVQEKLPPLKEGEILIESLFLTVWHSVNLLYYIPKKENLLPNRIFDVSHSFWQLMVGLIKCFIFSWTLVLMVLFTHRKFWVFKPNIWHNSFLMIES